MKKALWIILGIVVLIVVLGSMGGDDTTDTTQTAAGTTVETTTPATTVAVESFTATELYAAYEANEVSADQTYGGRLVEVTGTVGDIGLDILDNPYVTLDTGGVWSVQCLFTEDNADMVSGLTEGQDVSLTGTIDGLALGTNLTIDDCQLS